MKLKTIDYMDLKYNEKFLVDYISKFTNVDKSNKIVDISDELIDTLTQEEYNILKEIKKLKYSLQYTIR